MRGLLVVLLATGAFAAPFSIRKETSPSCNKRSNRFHHTREFPYNYEGETVSSITGASSARSGLKILARCIIKAAAPCQHVLRIDSVELWEAQSKNPGPLEYTLSQGSPAFAEELQAHDLVFRTDEGRVTEVLSHPEEPSHILNVKRGILSAMQVQFVEQHTILEEDDVVGRCRAQYHIKSRHLNGRPKVVYKSRNLSDCSDHAKTDLGIHVHSYDEQPVSLLRSNSACKLYLTAKNRAQRVVCEEEHVFRPFSAGYKNTSGAITTARQVLDLQPVRRVEPLEIAVDELLPVSLKYEHSKPQSNEEAVNEAFLSITILSRESQKETKPDSAQHFSKLVFSIRKLNTEAMETLWQKVHNEEDEKIRVYLYDALPHCGTGGCAKVMSNAVRNNLVSNERGNMFLAGLAMAGNPTEETIEHVLDLCEENPGRTSMLTLGTLLHKFCEASPMKCSSEDSENTIARAENFLKSQLGDRCDAETPEELESTLITLKAIGNAGRPVEAEEVLFKCALNPAVPMNMSIAALEALRRMPCSDQITSPLLEIYGDYDLDVELRIAAYLALMKCPNPEVFQEVARILKNEVNNQVGSFVWSHMTNAMDSTEPVHGQPLAEMMRDALSGMKLREFNLNRLRFSRAWEGSFYSDILRFGGSAQSHLIYHPSSFFPRSAMVNLTVDVLGASINVLETAARFEGFEILIEQFFGDDGYYPDERIMKMFDLKPHEERDKTEQTVKYIRGRRSIDDDLNRVETHLNKLHRTMDNRKHHPSGALSVKVFGNEMRLASFDDISWLNDEVDNINMVDILLKLAQGGKKTFTKSLMFLDAETTVPTILGLPLKLSAKGTTVASLELSGKFDIRNMFWGRMSFDVRGYAKPSAVVDISGRMGVSAFYADAGVLVNSSLYTATQLKGNATYIQGETLKFELGAPEEPVQIVNVSSSLFTTLNDKKIAIDGTPRRIEPAPCLNMTRLLGVTFCSHLSLPLGYREYESPFFPFSGPSSFSISVKRTDPKLTKYQLMAERLETEDENKYDIVSKMSTPGATWERNFEANGTLWFQKDGQLFQVSTGALGHNFGKFEATYNNISHAVNLTYSAKDAVYGYPIVLNGHFFNNSNVHTKELGVEISASYKNYTFRQMTKFYNKSHAYGYVSNFTYWPNRYLYSAGKLNITDRSLSFVTNHTCTQTEIRFHGKLGEEESPFVFDFTNKPTKLGVNITGRYLRDPNEGFVRVFLSPFEQSFSLRGSYLKMGDEKGIRFTASHDNKNRVLNWYAGIVNSTKEKSFKANATILEHKAEAMWTFFNFSREKGIKFNGTLLNKTIDSIWSYFNIGQQKGLKFKASGLNKTLQAAWTFFNHSHAKSLKFNASFVNKTVEAVWSYVNFGQEKGVKFNASLMNKTLDAVWSCFNYSNEKGLRFNVSAMNRTAEVVWSYFSFTKEKGLTFNATAFNRTINTALTFLNYTQEKSIRLNMTALNKTLEAVWSYVSLQNERGLSFNATALNQTIKAMLSYISLGKEKGVRFNASVLNQTIEAAWSFLNLTNERSLQFKARALNRTVTSALTFLSLPKQKSIKFNASVLNKTAEVAWMYENLPNENVLKLNATALNSSVTAVWSYLRAKHNKSIRFYASAMNRTMESVFTFFNLPTEKGLGINMAVMNRSMNTSLVFFRNVKDMGLRLNVSSFNKSVELMSKLLFAEKEKKLIVSAAYQNYTIAFVGLMQNFTTQKALCVYPEYFGLTHGKICLIYTNTSAERSMAVNMTILNRTGELKTQWFKTPNRCATRLTARCNKTTFFESWLSFGHKPELKTLHMNVTVFNKSAGATFYFQNRTEKAVGLNVTFLDQEVGIKGIWLNEKTFKETGIVVLWNRTVIATSSLKLVNSPKRKMVEFRGRVGRYVAEQQNVYITENEGKTEFVVLRMLRNGSQSLFFDSSSLVFARKEKSRELVYYYNLKAMGKSFHYGWGASYSNFSTAEDSYHEAKISLMYSKDKWVSLTAIYRNTSEELSGTLVVEYLPKKTMKHFLIWHKQRNTVELSWELLPRKPILWKVFWNTHEGFSINSILSFFNKKIANWFKFSSTSGEYEGHFEIFPAYPLKVNGIASNKRGLLLTTEIGFLNKTWNHKIELDRGERRLLVSVEVLPQASLIFAANLNMEEGLQITTNLKGFNKSLQWEGIYDNLTNTFTSDLTILKQKLIFTEQLDVVTKTLQLTLTAFGRRVGFLGRFDWKNYIASSYLIYQNSTAGWYLRFNPASRGIVFNVTLSPIFSGQIIGEMPDDSRLQVTIQRKFGVHVVNESRLTYHLSPESSRVSLTWNTTTIDSLAWRAESLKMLLKNVTLSYYNDTVKKAKNLTQEVDIMIKKLQEQIRPQALKLYAKVKSYDYKGLMENTTMIAQNLTYQLYNATIRVLNNSIENLPTLVRNATELYKRMCQNATDVYRRFRTEVLPPIMGNVTLHAKNISRDLKLWVRNVSVMMSGVTVRGKNISDIANRVSFKVREMTSELVKTLNVKTRELIVKVREIEIRKQKLGPLYDRYMMKVVDFTCGFNATCTLKNITTIVKNLTLRVRNITVLNKTVEYHFMFLKNRTLHMHQKAINFTRNLTIALPKVLRNVSIQAIHLLRNLTREVRNLTQKTMMVTLEAHAKMMKTHRPLINFITKVVISLKRRTTPLVVNVVQPVIMFARELKNNVTIYAKPMVMPLVPMALDMMYQVRNITVRSVPIGHAFDKVVNVSLYTAVEAFTMVNHSLSSNISAAIAFIRENSQKTPEEIVDLTIQKSIEFFNVSKKALNQSVELSFNLTKLAALVFNRTIVAVNKTLTKVLQMRPDEIVEIFIRKMQNITRNVTKEVLNVTKQLRSLDLARPVKVAWHEMDLKGKLESFYLKVRWGNVLQRIREFNIRDRALRFKWHTVNMTLYVLKELEDLTNVTYRALKLTRSLVRMEISKEDFVDEFIAIGQEGRRVLLKYAHLLKNTSLELSRKLRNSSFEMAERFKNTTMQNGLRVYEFLREHGLSFYSEHREEGLIVYNIYKEMIMKIYEGVKNEITAKVNAFRGKIMKEVETVVAKLRQYENMTYEEIVKKVYEFAKKRGLALYRNVSMRAMKVFNDTKNVTLRAYNYTLLLANRTAKFAVQHFKMVQNLTLRYYNMTRTRCLKYYNLTRHYTLKCCKEYYNLTRNYTLYTLNKTRAFALRAYNKTQAMALRGIRYLNQTIVPRAKEYYLKGIVIIQRSVNKTVILIKDSIKAIKDWYHEHKEKTVEELYFEVYGLAERKYGKMKEIVRKRLDELKEKLKIRTELWKTELQKLNKTVINVTGDLISIYNQTVNITLIATKDLVVIFSPYVNIIQNKTIAYLVKAKNFTLPLIEMARNATLQQLNETRKLVSEEYKKLMARKDLQDFIERLQLKEHYAKAEKFVRGQYNNVVKFVQQTKPRAEAKIKEVIFHLNVTLPNQIKALYNSVLQTYEEIVGNPKAYVDMLSNKAVWKVKETFKDTFKGTPIEEILMHEIWSDLFEEARQHELVEVGQELMNYTAALPRRGVDLISKKAKLLVVETKRKFKRMVESLKETRAKMMKKFEELKRLKLHEIVEHKYVLKAIDLAKNLSIAGENITAEIRNLTRKWLVIGNFYYKNFTARIQNCTLTLKKHYDRLYEKHIIPFYENCTSFSQNYKQIARHFVDLCRNMSLRGLNITRNWTTAKINMTRMWINETMAKGVKYYREELVPLYYKKVLPYYTDIIAPFYKNCTRVLIELKKNVTERAMMIRLQAVNLTQRAINLTLASEPYAMLRRFGRMTVRESVIEGRAMYIRGYNYTLNLTRIAINMTMQKMNTTKTHLTQIIMDVQNTIPLRRLMNATLAEITETAVFINKYYGIEVALRHRLRKSLDITRNLTRQVVDYHAPRFLKTSALKTLEFVNTTILFVNRTVAYLNVTIQNVTHALNKTLHEARTALRKTITDIRVALPNYIQVKEGSVTVIIPHPRPVNGTFKMLPMDSVQMIKDLNLQALEKAELMKWQVKEKIGNLQEKAKNLTRRVKILTRAWVAIADNKTLLYRQTAYKFVTRMYNLAKTHPVTRRCINATLHCLNITRDFARAVYFTQVKNVTDKYLTPALNVTRQLYLLGLNVTRNVTLKVYNVAVNATLDIYNSSGLLEAFDKSRNYSMMALNTTLEFFEKHNNTLVKKYLPMALNFSSHWCRTGFNATRNFSTTVYNLAVNVSLDIYNSSSLREAFDKCRNYSKVALNGTLELYQKMCNKTRLEKYLPVVLNYSKMALNTTLEFFEMHNNTLVKTYLPMALNFSSHWCRTGFNATRNFSTTVYNLAVNVSLDICNSSSLREAFDKCRNYSKIALNGTLELYQKMCNMTRLEKYLPVVLNYSKMALNTTLEFFEMHNNTLVKTYLPMALNFSSHWCRTGFNATRNFSTTVYNLAVNVSLDICNSSSLREAFDKCRNYSKVALNGTLELYQKLCNKTRLEYLPFVLNYSKMALNTTLEFFEMQNNTLVKTYLPMALNFSSHWCRTGFNATRNFSTTVYNLAVNVSLDIYNSSSLVEAFDKCRNYSKIALNGTLELYQKMCNKTRLEKYLLVVLNYSKMALNTTVEFFEMHNSTLVKTYLPMALNFSSHWCRTGFNATRNFSTTVYNLAVNVSLDIYNSSSLVEAFDKGRNYSKIALNGTLELYQKLYQRMLENYVPFALNLSRQWYSTGLNTTRNFTVMVYKLTKNVSMDVYNSSSLLEALEKVRNYSIRALNATEKLYRALQKKVVVKYAELYNLTMIKYIELYNRTLDRYAEMYNRCMELYRRIAEHETTLRYMNHAQNYLEQSRKMIKNRARHFQIVKRYWQKRVNHKVSQISRLLNPASWIPPFNSTAMIFGGPHVYTFDKTYYTFPGYRNSFCTYVLARDVRDNKFTILSQETAIIIITEDSNVKIHQNGRVESVTKIATSGKKLSGGYASELPVKSANTTVTREGSFIVFRHDLGLEIICDVEHYLCSFNIARWYHGRMAGLLGTNNNEYHDEMMTSNNSIAGSLIEFVNSWEVTRDPECQLTFIETEGAKCAETSYIQRCRALFKDKESPLGHLKSFVDPEPFIKACEIDYKDCDSETPKDMKHCNTTAAYVELVRLQGEWADYLPECARCGINQIGQRWFQGADKMVDVVILVHETSVLKSYAEKLPTFLTSLTDAFETYSFRFGVVGFGGQSVHSSPHAVTLDGQHMNDLMNLEQAIEHLDFTAEPLENETSDALDAILFAARTYSFRPGATKIFLLLDNVEHENDAMSMSRVSRMLDASDITLNVIGKYKKFRGEIIGQDYRGKVFYRKKPDIGTGVVELPEGEYVALMKSTHGSVFGLPFLGSDRKDKFGALQKASISTWREQIKRDQLTCKECFCARGDAGQGKVICKNNSLHNKC